MNEKACFQVREMRPEDLKEVLRIERTVFPTPWSRELFLYEMQKSTGSMLTVAEKDGKVVGYLMARTSGSSAHVINLAVSPDMRRKGIATALMEDCFRRIVKGSGTSFRLEVRETNLVARAFYGKMGFRELETRIGYYSDTGENAVVMIREFAGGFSLGGRMGGGVGHGEGMDEAGES